MKLPNLLKKFVFSFLASLVFLFSFSPVILAQGANTPVSSTSTTDTWYNQNFKDWFSKVSDPDNPSDIFGERYTSAQVEWVIYGVFAFFINHVTPPGTAGPCIGGDITACAAGIKSFFDSLEKTADAAPSQNLASMVLADRPISGISYFKEKVQNFSLVPVAHAQVVGFGFGALKPVQEMWRASRDAAFGLFVLVSIVFAFMIMFRVKLNPQTVVSVQSSIPKIIIALVLVTFSYAIAGFLIDFMYVVIGILSVILSTFIPSVLGIKPPPSAIFSLLTQGNLLGMAGINIQSGIMGMLFLYLSPLILAFTIISIGVAALGGGLLVFIPIIIIVIVAIVGLWNGLKIIWALLKAFVNILLLTIFAPLQLAIGVIVPGLDFNQWVRSYVSNLSVFVVTGVLWFFSMLFLVQGIIIGLKDIAGPLVLALVSPIFGAVPLTASVAQNYTTWPPLLGSGNNLGVGFLFLGVSFVFFTLIPKATEIIQGFISGKPFAYGTAVGEAFGGVGLAYGATLQGGVEGMRKFGQEQMLVNLMTRLNNEMQTGRLQWVPQPIKTYMGVGSAAKPQPFH